MNMKQRNGKTFALPSSQVDQSSLATMLKAKAVAPQYNEGGHFDNAQKASFDSARQCFFNRRKAVFLCRVRMRTSEAGLTRP